MSELKASSGGKQTSTKNGTTDEQREVMVHLFKNSTYIDDDGALDFNEFCELMKNEPTLVKAMFCTIATILARKAGFTFDFEDEALARRMTRMSSLGSSLSRKSTLGRSLSMSNSKVNGIF
uniref:EF-hand domain-containing protein n=1 Tax=Eutreptiella gymnastica TaxID=73025 RepID=A0A7S4CRC9_9EUGL